MPRVRLVSESVQNHGTYLEMDLVNAETVAVTSVALSLEPNSSGTAQILSESPDSMLIETETSGEQLLVIAESYHEGWAAWVDGIRREVFDAYGGLAMAVLVGPGHQEVRLAFEPESVRLGRWLSGAGIAITVIWILMDCRPSRFDGTRP